MPTGFSAVFRPTNRLFGCLGTVVGSSSMPSSAEGPRFVAARSSSIQACRVAGLRWDGDDGSGVQKKKVQPIRLTSLPWSSVLPEPPSRQARIQRNNRPVNGVRFLQ